MRYLTSTITACLFVLSAGVSAELVLSATGQPKSYDLVLEPPAITGFGDVRFGMRVDEVRALLEKTYPDASITEAMEPLQRTPILNLVVPKLAPVGHMASPVPATLNYVFGASSKKLMAINLDWYAEGNASPAQRRTLLDMGAAYVATLVGYQWSPRATSRGLVVGPNEVMLFAGRDHQDRGVEVVAQGVPLDVVFADGRKAHRDVKSGPAHLRIRLSAQPDDPDVFRLPDGAF